MENPNKKGNAISPEIAPMEFTPKTSAVISGLTILIIPQNRPWVVAKTKINEIFTSAINRKTDATEIPENEINVTTEIPNLDPNFKLFD